MKHLLPTLREKKRYVVFEVISEQPIDANHVQLEIEKSFLQLFGELGYSEAGPIFLHERYNKNTQQGMIKIGYKHVEQLRTAFAMIKHINGKKTIIRSICVSGILKKAASAASSGKEKMRS